VRRAGLLFALVVLAGCGGDGRRDAVDAAERWMQAVADRDTKAACALMRPSAVDAVRQKYAGLGEKANCAAVMRAYRDAFKGNDIDKLVDAGLEAEGTVKKGEVGVFPASGDRQLQVVLMRRRGDEWQVASTTIDPRGVATPAGS
jgi:hypothetical protein